MGSINSLLTKSGLQDEAIAFSKVKIEDFLPALNAAIETAKTRLQNLKQNKEPATFKNTIEALETFSEEVDRVAGLFYFLYSAEGPENLQNLAREISPLLASFSSDVTLDADLFKRIKVVYEQRAQLALNPEELQLLEKQYRDFVRNGALLNVDEKNQLRQLDQELSLAGPLFSENVLKATNAFEMVVTNKEDLAGLPESQCESAWALAQSKGLDNAWVFNLQFPSFGPFLQYSDKRELREKMWKAYNSMCLNDKFDNQETVLKIVRLRHERANLLGYKTHANFVLEERMAKNPETVMTFLDSLYGSYRKAAEKDLEEVREFKKSLSGDASFWPWDYGYYAEKLKLEKFHFRSEDLRPYFRLENCIEGMFEHAKKLFNIHFEPIKNLDSYHPDVKIFEVKDLSNNAYLGLFYADFFPRETKKSGAWATTLRDQGLFEGTVKRPHVAIVCNFTKPTATKPSLLTFDEVSTLFHEFGHALHMLLSQCRYRSLSGANVYWDFVELPSQIMENWIEHKESLDLFSKHYETGDPIPEELVEKIRNASRFQVGYFSLRQLNFGFLDMAWHSTAPETMTSLTEFERTATEKTRLFPVQENTSISAHFSHIFAGGYSSGYYSYKWAEVLDADAFEYFKEKGLFNPELGQKFREAILSKGGTKHPMELYKQFRGREPDPKALLRREGLLP